MQRIVREHYEVILLGSGGGELCSEGHFGTVASALLAIPRLLKDTPNAASWEVVKVTRAVSRSGKGRPTEKELLSARHR